ncbi:MAG: hypothetical protein ABIS03_05725 [Gemmatimonadaceae bacterium]
MTLSIRLVEHQETFTSEWLADLSPAGVVACDFYVAGAESAKSVIGGYSFGKVLNIDHHAPTAEMSRHVSSTNLALARIRACGREPDTSLIVISHTDCDSVLSSAVMSGQLPPDDVFGDAAIAADHTGEPNDLADLLQGLDDCWDKKNPRDPLYFIDVARRFVNEGELSLDAAGRAALADRQRKRAAAAAAVARGDITVSNGLGFGLLTEKLDGEFFPDLLRDALVILLLTPRRENPSRWDAKFRLGHAAPSGSSLHQLGILEFDPAFGGRWNAGSNTRNLGTSIHPEAYKAELLERLGRLQSDQALRSCQLECR